MIAIGFAIVCKSNIAGKEQMQRGHHKHGIKSQVSTWPTSMHSQYCQIQIWTVTVQDYPALLDTQVEEVTCLIEAVGAALGEEGLHIGMAQHIILVHPLDNLHIGANSGGLVATKCHQIRL